MTKVIADLHGWKVIYKVEQTFSSMKLIKTQLLNRMGESTLEHTMIICIEGPERLSNETLEEVIDHYKHSKRRIML